MPARWSGSRRRSPRPRPSARRPDRERQAAHRESARRSGDRRPDRRGPAIRRTCRGDAPAGRRPSPPPAQCSGACCWTSGSCIDLVVRGHRADHDRVARRRARRAVRRCGRCRPASPGRRAAAAARGSSDCPPASTLPSSPARRERLHGFVHCGRSDVVERCRDHRAPASFERPPHPLGRARHRYVGDAERAQRVDDRVDHRRGGRDRAGLANSLYAKGIRRRRAHRAVGGERRKVGRRRHEIVDERAGGQVAFLVVDAPPRTAPGRCPARGRRAPGPRRSAG